MTVVLLIQFKDLNEVLEIVPVVELGAGVAIAVRAYEWVGSLARIFFASSDI